MVVRGIIPSTLQGRIVTDGDKDMLTNAGVIAAATNCALASRREQDEFVSKVKGLGIFPV